MKFQKINEVFIKRKRLLGAAIPAAVLSTVSVITVSAAPPASTAIVTTAMLTPILTGLQDNIAVILPVGLGIFAIFMAVSYIPKLFKKFTS